MLLKHFIISLYNAYKLHINPQQIHVQLTKNSEANALRMCQNPLSGPL